MESRDCLDNLDFQDRWAKKEFWEFQGKMDVMENLDPPDFLENQALWDIPANR